MNDFYVDHILRRIDQSGVESLTDIEADYFAVFQLMRDVSNGGFEQYFYNYTGDQAQRALRMFKTVGAPLDYATEFLTEAIEMFDRPYETDNAASVANYWPHWMSLNSTNCGSSIIWSSTTRQTSKWNFMNGLETKSH